MRVIHQHCDCQWCCMCLNFGRKHRLEQQVRPNDLSHCDSVKQRRPEGHLRHARAPWRNSSPKARGGEIRHRGFSRRKKTNNKCKNPSHACTPRRNPSPPLWPVTSARPHAPTDQHPIWADLRFLRVSFRYVFIICFAPMLALLKLCLLLANDASRNIITLCRPMQENWGFCIVTTTRAVWKIQTRRAGITVLPRLC